MIDLRTAAQQALEALHEIGWSNDTRWQSDRAATVIPALRAALAEPVPEPVPEPVAWGLFAKIDGEFVLQHPVRFSEVDVEDDRLMYSRDTVIEIRPLCIAPPQRKPLSEDEIFAIENDIPDDVISDRAWTICFARAVEAAHDIK